VPGHEVSHQAPEPGVKGACTVQRRRRFRSRSLASRPFLRDSRWEGLANGLQHETGLIEQARKKNKGKFRCAKVADYVIQRDRENQLTGNPSDEPVWADWLQDNRIELNAMTSPQRVVWVEQKFALHGVKKVIPPEEIAREVLSKQISDRITEQVEEEVLRAQEAWIDQQIDERLGSVELPSNIGFQVAAYLKTHRSDRWTRAIDAIVIRVMSL
jgi:hypothetical protein